jgi:TRAP-type C4-dicarboxylate transport system permease small subunit
VSGAADEEAPSPFDVARDWAPRMGIFERVAQVICQVLLAVMVLLIAAEVATRALTGASLEITDEIGGYLLAALTFISMPVCLVENAFHRVEFIQARLSERGRAFSELLFDLLSFACAGILLWQLWRMEAITWRSDDLAPTNLMTPLWIPRAAMVLGTGILCITLLRILARDLRRIVANGRAPR